MNDKKRRTFCLRLIGTAISVLGPMIATLSYFPLRKEKGAMHLISGISLIFILLSGTPIYRWIKRSIKSPSAPFLWFAIFLAFYLLSRIAEEIIAISFIGFVSNLIGAIFFYPVKASGENENEE